MCEKTLGEIYISVHWRVGDIDSFSIENNKEDQSSLVKTWGDKDLVCNESGIRISIERGIEP